jgi:hypothetical protein
MFGDAVTVKSYATQDEADMDLVSGRLIWSLPMPP